MKVFGKKLGSVLLFGSMMFTTVGGTSVYADEDVASVTTMESDDVGDGDEVSKNEGNEEAAGSFVSGKKGMLCLAAVPLVGAAGAAAGFACGKYSASSDKEAENKEAENKEAENKEAVSSKPGCNMSVFDVLGALSYIPGFGSDAKTASGKLNAWKLSIVLTMHVLGIVAVVWRATERSWGEYWKDKADIFNGILDVIVPPAGLLVHATRHMWAG